jgi:D-2-hydroxyglutarate dehydrogenase
MLIETSGSNKTHDEEKLNDFLQLAMDTSLIVDGVSTNEPGKMRNIWLLRERIADSLINVDGYCFKYDISLPLTHFYDIVPATRERVGDLASFVCGYGHVGELIASKKLQQMIAFCLSQVIQICI